MLHRQGGRPGERRTARRFARRAQVRFWVHGDDEPRNAFIHDISTSGLFISTPYPLPRGTEIRVEISDKGTTYTVEAVVARRVWVAPDLRKLGPTGMGARFLAPDELVQRLKQRDAGRVTAAKQREDHFLIVLEDDENLLRTYLHDLEMGGLFIPTEAPPALNREIQVEFQFPGGDEVFAFSARVVQRVPAGQTGNNLRAGMAVVFEDTASVLARLRPFLDAKVVALGPPTGGAVSADS
jgi:Tfp pilus assembly protein PilZ